VLHGLLQRDLPGPVRSGIATPRKLRGSLAEKTRGDHAVKDAGWCRRRGIEVEITIEVGETKSGTASDQSGHNAERDRAITAEDEQEASVGTRQRNFIRDIANNPGDAPELLLLGVAWICSGDNSWEISAIQDRKSVLQETMDKPERTQGIWAFFLPTVPGTRTGWDTEDRDFSADACAVLHEWDSGCLAQPQPIGFLMIS